MLEAVPHTVFHMTESDADCGDTKTYRPYSYTSSPLPPFQETSTILTEEKGKTEKRLQAFDTGLSV